MGSERTAGGLARRGRPAKPRPLATVLGRALAPAASRSRSSLERIRFAWTDLCGLPLARHLEPLDIEHPFLRIGVRDRQWREAVFQQRHLLSRRVRQLAPELRGIRLVSLAPVMAPAEPPRPEAPPDPRTAGIGDTGLRAAFDALLRSRDAAADG